MGRTGGTPDLRWKSVVCCVAVGTLAVGCFSDPPPEPEEAPLEVVVASPQQPETPCLLNRSELGAGTHEVIVVAERGPATVRIRDASRVVVWEGASAPQAEEELPETLPEGQVPMSTVELAAGEYVVECLPEAGEVASTGLHVVPARPGYEDRGPLR